MATTEALGPISFATLDANASGDTTLVAAIAGKQIRVLSLALVSSGGVSAKFKSGATDLTGPMSLVSGTPLEASAPWGCFQTEADEALALNLTSATQVSGWLVYQEVL